MENMYEKLASQGKLRDRLMVIMRKHPRTIAGASREMDINSLTLARFLRGKGKVAWVQLCRIEDYVLKFEAKNNSPSDT